MSSLATVKTDSMLSDFSTSLLNVTVSEKEVKTDKPLNKISSNKECSRNNYNLSSVLSRIRDSGSAYDKRDKCKGESENKSKGNQADENSQDLELTEDTLHLSSNKLFNGGSVNFITRTQLLLLFVFFVVMIGVAMYTLDSQVKNSIEQSMQNINDNYSSISHNHEDKIGNRVLVKSNEISPSVMNDVSLITNSVSVLADEIRSLRKELEWVKGSVSLDDRNVEKKITAMPEVKRKKPKTISSTKKIGKVAAKTKEANRTSQSNVKEVSAKNIKANDPVTIDIVSKKLDSFLVVNVASLSNEDKANKMIERLDAAGLSPLLEKVVVKGKQLYRISVKGFTDLDEAKLFIRNAPDKYGVKGSRIRKN